MSFDDHFHYPDTTIHLRFMTWVTRIFLELLLFLTYLFGPPAPCSVHFSSRYSRAWGPVNRWAEVVDIDVLRRLFENALAPCRIFFQGNQWIFSARKKGLILFWCVLLWEGYLAPGRVAWPAMMLTLDKLECSLLYVVSKVIYIHSCESRRRGATPKRRRCVKGPW